MGFSRRFIASPEENKPISHPNTVFLWHNS